MKRSMIIAAVSGAMFLLAGKVCVIAEPAAANSPARPAGQEKITLNFKDASVGQVLEYLSETAGLVIMSDTDVEGRVNLISRQPVGVDEAIALINTILKENDYAALRMGKTLKLVKMEDARHLNLPVTVGNVAGNISAGDDVITHIVPLRFVEAVKLKNDISALVPSDAVVSSNEASNSLIITDTRSNIKRLVEIIEALDTQISANADVRVFRLVYADAQNTADLINDVFDQSSSQRQGSNMPNPFAMMRGFGRGGGGQDDTSSQNTRSLNIRITASADRRTNSVVVSGPADTLGIIAKVVRELDANPDEERSIFVYPLKNAKADNLKSVLNNLFQQMQQLNRQNTLGSGGGGGGRMTGTTGSRSTTAGNRSGTNTDDLSDQLYIEADKDTNSLLIMTSSKNYDKIRKIISDLDKPVPQVLIKVLLAEVTTTNNSQLGTEFSVLNLRSGGGETHLDTDFTNALRNNPGAGLTAKVIEGDILSATLKALQETGKLNVLSRPYILTSNNQKATITVGKRVPFIQNTRTTETGQTLNTIQYEDIGIILAVTPNVNPEGLVIMDVKPEISTTTTETVPISETVNAAVFAKRSSQSRVAVRNGQTIVIGGLMEDKETDSVQKVPLLGDIPLVGELFKKTVKEKEKTELLIFLTPQVAGESEDLSRISENERSKSGILNKLDENKSLMEHIDNMETIVPKVNSTPDTNDAQGGKAAR